MTETKKKKDEKTAVDPNTPLSQLLLDCGKDKYRMVSLATRWALEVQARDPQTPHQAEELVSMALREILTGQVDLEEIESSRRRLRLRRKSTSAPPSRKSWRRRSPRKTPARRKPPPKPRKTATTPPKKPRKKKRNRLWPSHSKAARSSWE